MYYFRQNFFIKIYLEVGTLFLTCPTIVRKNKKPSRFFTFANYLYLPTCPFLFLPHHCLQVKPCVEGGSAYQWPPPLPLPVMGEYIKMTENDPSWHRYLQQQEHFFQSYQLKYNRTCDYWAWQTKNQIIAVFKRSLCIVKRILAGLGRRE